MLNIKIIMESGSQGQMPEFHYLLAYFLVIGLKSTIYQSRLILRLAKLNILYYTLLPKRSMETSFSLSIRPHKDNILKS